MWFRVKSPIAQSGLLLPVSFILSLHYSLLLHVLTAEWAPPWGPRQSWSWEKAMFWHTRYVFHFMSRLFSPGEQLPVPIAGSSGCRSHNVEHDSTLASHSMSIWFICLLLGSHHLFEVVLLPGIQNLSSSVNNWSIGDIHAMTHSEQVIYSLPTCNRKSRPSQKDLTLTSGFPGVRDRLPSSSLQSLGDASQVPWVVS